jgi:hypothetical protein
VAAFHVVSVNPSGAIPRNTDHVRVTFDRAIDPTTFTLDQVAVTGPGGPFTVTGVVAVDGSNNTQFDISFAALTATGSYSLSLGTAIQDVYGYTLAGYVTTLTITDNYVASATTFSSNDIFGQAGTQALTFTSGQVYADDDYGTINLGGNSFRFYDQTYTQLFVSSNGLITFGSGNSSYTPTNLVSGPSQAALAVYWTDLYYSSTSQPMIVYQFNGDQLIIEWHNVTTYPSGSSANMTFQAILNLNTGSQPGDIVLNYLSVTGQGASDDNFGVTVGVKGAGTGSTILHTVVEDGSSGLSSNPDVQTGHAIRLSAS